MKMKKNINKDMVVVLIALAMLLFNCAYIVYKIGTIEDKLKRIEDNQDTIILTVREIENHTRYIFL